MGTHVCELLGFARIHRHVIGTGIFANDHALIDFLLWPDEEAAAFLDSFKRISGAYSAFHRHEHAIAARRNVAFVRCVFLKNMRHDTVTLGAVDQVGFKSDEASGGAYSLDRNCHRKMLHGDDFRLTTSKGLENVSEVFRGNFHIDRLQGLQN